MRKIKTVRDLGQELLIVSDLEAPVVTETSESETGTFHVRQVHTYLSPVIIEVEQAKPAKKRKLKGPPLAE